MNYIEANIIVSQIYDAYANGKNSLCGIPQSCVPFYSENWKQDLTDAASLFVAHAILWNTWGMKEIDTLFGILRMTNIVPDEFARKGKNALDVLEKSKSAFYKKTHKRAVENAENFMKSFRIPMFSTDSIANVHNHMLRYKREIIIPRKDAGDDIDQVVYKYAVEAYRVANVPFKEKDNFFFYTFDQDREWLNSPSMRKYFIPYEDHLLTHKK